MQIAVKSLKPWSAFIYPVWEGMESPITYTEVAQAVSSLDLRSEAWFSRDASDWPCSRQQHVQRVAYFVVYPCLEPIKIDVSYSLFGTLPQWIVKDGNHRLAAAFYRGDEFIEADLMGDTALIKELFGVTL